MISRKVLYRASAGQSTHYYSDQKDDYYSRDGEAAVWQGKGAEALGLAGEIDRERFQALLRGDFGQGITLTKSVRKDSRARAGIDLTFSAPKSITLQALIGGDQKVIAAHDAAVKEALNHIESVMVQARYKEGRQSHIEKTDNLIIAKFRHETARPTPGSPPDPQLHTHAIIMNLTKRSDGAWTALSNEEIFKSQKLIDAVYMNTLAAELEKAGYAIRYEKNHVELAHISREQIDVFSKRGAAVEAGLESHGLNRMTASHEMKQSITLSTRQAKDMDISREDLHQSWVSQADDIGINFKDRQPKELGTSYTHTPKQDYIAPRAIRWAINHLTEREAVTTETSLLTAALNHATGKTTLEDLKAELGKFIEKGDVILGKQHYTSAHDTKLAPRTRDSWVHEMHVDHDISPEDANQAFDRAVVLGNFVPSEPHYTTARAHEAELQILAIEMEGRGAMEPIMDLSKAKLALENLSLLPGQRKSAELILTTSNRIVGVQGLAGSGKSHMLKLTKDVLEANGYRMVALAAYGSQVDALRELGVEANTIASRLEATNRKRLTEEIDNKTVVVVDEAGVVPNRQMRQLLRRLEAVGAHIVTLGDTEQTKAIEAGRPFELLQAAGMETARMDDIIRQINPQLKIAVEHAAVGKASTSLTFIETVQQIEDDGERYKTLAGQYVDLPAEQRKETLIVTGTNDSRNAINAAAHKLMGLAGKGHDYPLLTRRDSTQAERRYSKYYHPNDIIQPERDYACGLKRGELYKIIGMGEASKLRVESLSDGQHIDFLPLRTRKISVYEPVTAELSAGDWVRVTKNNADLNLNNGSKYQVRSVSPEAVILEGKNKEIVLPTDQPLHLDYAYTTTAHSAQGLTCDQVIINAESYSRTTKSDVYYVGISRARHNALIFTNDKSKLPAAINRREDKSAAMDIVDRQKTHQKEAEISIS